MNIRNGIDQINPIFPSPPKQVGNATPGASVVSQEAISSDQAKLSAAASHVATSAAESEVRMEKVACIQSALLAGTYRVSADKVAEHVISAMLHPES